MMSIKRMATSAFAVVALSGAFIGSASATVINFDQDLTQPRTGQLSYDGSGALVGSTISFSTIDIGTGAGFTCQNRCELSFSTGDNLSEPAGGNPTYTFDSGGFFSLDGTLVDNSTGNTVAGTGDNIALISGTFSGTQSASKIGSNSVAFVGNGSANVSDAFLSYLGLDTDTMFVFLNTTYSLSQATFGSDGSFSGKVSNADLTLNSVPEPGDLAMFGLGLLLVGGGLAARRRYQG